MPLSYRDAGVDIDAGAELVGRIAPLAAATRTAQVLSKVGGFAGLCTLPEGLAEPVLVSGTDGVGTKLAVAFLTGVHDTVGVDLVAMCVNDVITSGARPLFFLDYFATGTLDVEVAEAVIQGIAEGCTQAECALLGGETAELPGMYADGHYDLAGFAVGVVERSELLPRPTARAGDVLVAMGSSGLHSNGYSLARRVLLGELGLGLDDPLPGLDAPVGATLLTPTRIYVRTVAALRRELGPSLRALAHITGGGLPDNLPRVLRPGLAARIDLSSYERPPLFDIIQRGGPVDEDEMRRTFNLGVGLVAVVEEAAADRALAALAAADEPAWILGQLEAAEPDAPPTARFVDRRP